MADKKLNIGFVLPYVGAKIGGGFTFSREILVALAKNRIACPHSFYALIYEGLETPPLEIPTLILSQKSSLPRVSKILDIFSALRLKVARPPLRWLVDGAPIEERLDLIVCLYPGALEDVNVLQASTIWDLSHRYLPGMPELTHNKDRRNREAKFQRIVRTSDFLITGTERGKQELVSYYGVEERCIHLIPHPTPEDALQNAANREASLVSPREPFALYPAQLWPHKNHMTLLRAWKNLPAQSNLRLLCPGNDYQMKGWLEERARAMGLEGRVEFPGFVTREQLLDLYAKASILVYPSLFGPENLPPLEAFALSCPVIASDIPGAAEQLGDAALRVDPLDDAAWTRAILRLTEDHTLRETLIQNGRKRAASFTAEHFARELINMIDHIAKLRSLWPDREWATKSLR
ncbi:MAG: glycosyltransferase family 1 protein [Chthoniobacterales bacterium]